MSACTGSTHGGWSEWSTKILVAVFRLHSDSYGYDINIKYNFYGTKFVIHYSSVLKRVTPKVLGMRMYHRNFLII